MDLPLPGPIVLPRPALPTPHPAPPLPTPHPTPHPSLDLPAPQAALHHPADALPAHSPIPPAYVPPLPGLAEPLPSEPAEAGAEAEAAVLPGGPLPTRRRRREDEDDMDKVLRRIVKQFPPCRFIAAYGSAVFPQPPAPLPDSTPARPAPPSSVDSAPPMLDLLLVVDDVLAWHTANLSLHPSHYSFIRHIGGAPTIASINALPAYLYYNTNVFMPTDPGDSDSAGDQPRQLVKYGVISVDRVTDDLSRWTTLYTAGRLHKPVRILQPSPVLAPHLTTNLASALTVACYLAPQPQSQSQPQSPSDGGAAVLSEVELYTLLASLSYTGDVRMGIAEDPMKVVRIVTGSFSHFQSLYADPISRCEWLQPTAQHPSGLRSYRIDAADTARRRMADALPAHLYDVLAAASAGSAVAGRGVGGGGSGGMWWAGVGVVEQQVRMRAGLASIVRSSSWQQSMKGMVTAGVWNGLRYGLRKVAKAWK